jgi:hypothetical protein
MSGYLNGMKWIASLGILFLFCSCQQEDLPAPLGSEMPELRSSAIEVNPAMSFNRAFTQYGPGWTGGDAVYSLPLPDGRILWIFADTWLGVVNPDRSRPGGQPFVNNSLVIQDGDDFITLHGGTASSPASYFDPGIPDNFYWPADAFIAGDKVYVFLPRIFKYGPGMWDFGLDATDIARLNITDLSIEEIFTWSKSNNTTWGAGVYETSDSIYVYGSENGSFGKHMHVGRFPISDPMSREFWDGTAWNPAISESARIFSGNSNQFSVFKHIDGSYHLLNQGDFFSDEIHMYDAPGPIGPFSNQRTVVKTPLDGGDIFTYNALVHPQFTRADGTILVGWCINSFNFLDHFSNADVYRPYFAWVKDWE